MAAARKGSPHRARNPILRCATFHAGPETVSAGAGDTIMSDEEQKAANDGAKKVSYPQKYWWVILIALPLALALVKLVPDLVSKKGDAAGFKNQQTGDHNVAISGSNNVLTTDLSTKTYVISLAAIEKEYAQVKREPLRDEELKKEIEEAIALLNAGKAQESAAAFEVLNRKLSLPSLQTDLGVAYQKAGDTQAAARALSQALAQDPQYAPAQYNLGLVKASRGELAQAQTHFEKSGELGESQALASAIRQELVTKNLELEPNNQAAEANILPLEKKIEANIVDPEDSDYFRITSPGKYRDILQVRLENLSPTLRPALALYDKNKSELPGALNDTPNANLEHEFVTGPAETFYFRIYGRSSSTGRYRVEAVPLKKYDALEPNDTIREPSALELGKTIAANIMDGGDVDYYKFTTGALGTTVRLRLTNQSDTLRPGFACYNANKSEFPGNYDDTADADLEHSFAVQPGAVYFLKVYGRSGSAGAYELTAMQE